jgi:2,4-dienoyl-CoA reductase (NADPH2)
MLDLVSDGSSWEEIVDLAARIEAAGATIINTGIGNTIDLLMIIINNIEKGLKNIKYEFYIFFI